jgi:eukaryotic-like serine/threonine-protein kinase
MIDFTGQELGNYRLIRLLSRGKFSDVYLGEHVSLGTHAAIKVLPSLLQEDAVNTFLIEARIASSLDHPHIIHVLDFEVQQDRAFLIMDYAPNGTAAKRYPPGTPLPLHTIVDYTNQAASALQYAHNQKLIHRNIKPENMLLGRNNEILLSDFGMATIIQSTRIPDPQELAGSAAYMAPEQLQGKPCAASDQYAFTHRDGQSAFISTSTSSTHEGFPPLACNR